MAPIVKAFFAIPILIAFLGSLWLLMLGFRVMIPYIDFGTIMLLAFETVWLGVAIVFFSNEL